jgi:hypothetical protein
MASNLKYATALKNGKLDVITSQLGASALLKIYDGTQPAGPGTAVTTQNLLATLTCNASAFAASASGGVLTANAIGNANASASGTASWFRVTTSGGSALIDGSVGTSSADLIIDNTSINSGQAVSVTSLTVTSGN